MSTVFGTCFLYYLFWRVQNIFECIKSPYVEAYRIFMLMAMRCYYVKFECYYFRGLLKYPSQD